MSINLIKQNEQFLKISTLIKVYQNIKTTFYKQITKKQIPKIQDKKMTKQDCILCAQQAEFIGVGECNHQPICYRCIYKMRVISKNNSCPICKTQCKQVIIMPTFQPFSSIKKQVLPDKTYGDIFYVSQEGKKQFQKLTQYKCFVKMNGKSCKNDKKFPSVAFLKKHLKQDHHRHMCDICVQKKTCVLQQQKLYTFNQLNKHLQRGDIDQFGNIVFLHPYCGFCKTYFFDDDLFKVHINLQHMTCNVCGSQQKYRYYKNYGGLETHYKMSHYICTQSDCLDKKFIAFKTADELKLHRMQLHQKNNKKIDIKQLCGFQYQGHNPNDQKIIIKDKEGIDMETQFLSLKKSKNRTLGQADQQQDQIFDIRDFYRCDLDQDQHAEKVFKKANHKQVPKAQDKDKDKKEENQQHKTQNNKGGDKKKKYVSKQQVQKTQKQQKSQKPQKQQKKQNKQPQRLMLQDLLLVQSIHWSKWSNQQFDSKMKTVVNEDVMKKFIELRKDLFKKKIREDEFVSDYLRIMKTAGLQLAYNVFPHFLRTVIHEDVKQKLDTQFLKKLKQLPTKCQNSLLKSSYKYSDFFGKFLKEIEKNIQNRIVNGTLSIKKQVKKNKQRIYQIVGVVRRLKIHQMAKLKFATNFGLQKDTVDYILTKIFKQNINDIQRRIQKIQNQEFLDLYVFTKYCYQAIKHAQNMRIQKHKIHENILQDFLFDRPHLEQKYGLKKQQLKTLQQKVEFQKLQEQKKVKKQLKQIEKKNQSFGFTNQSNFSLEDKGDFPELVIGKKSQQQKTNSNLKDLLQDTKNKPVTYQKKINQLFPTLGQQIPNKFQKKKSSQQSSEPQVKQQKKQKQWWQKINEKKKNQHEQQEPQVIKVRQGKNKKQKWLSVKMDGLFGAK